MGTILKLVALADCSLPNIDPESIFVALDELLEAARRPAWHARAACRGVGTAVFFTARGESVEPAKAYCDRCPVTNECLASADNGFGVWGATTVRERRRHRKRSLGLIVSSGAA